MDDDAQSEVAEEFGILEETEGGEMGEGSKGSSSNTARVALPKGFRTRRAGTPGEPNEKLTPEEHGDPRRSLERIRHSIVSPLADYKIPRFGLPHRPQIGIWPAVIRKLPGAQGVYDQVAKSILPTIPIQAVSNKNLPVINSDIIKGFSATQLRMQSIPEQLGKNVDLGAFSQYRQRAEQFRAQQVSWFKNFTPNFDKLKAAFWPPNLRGIEDLDLDEIEAVVLLDGIGLYNVPRQSIAIALIRADSAQKRREILGRSWTAISSDCREALESCESEALANYASTAISALDALDAKHTHAAQALIGSLTDALLIDYLGDTRYLYTPNKKTKNSDAYKRFGIRKYIALAPMWQAYQQFRVENGDTVPSTFNRHATAHTVNGRQFNRRNAVQGLLFVCGLITFLEELIQRHQA